MSPLNYTTILTSTPFFRHTQPPQLKRGTKIRSIVLEKIGWFIGFPIMDCENDQYFGYNPWLLIINQPWLIRKIYPLHRIWWLNLSVVYIYIYVYIHLYPNRIWWLNSLLIPKPIVNPLGLPRSPTLQVPATLRRRWPTHLPRRLLVLAPCRNDVRKMCTNSHGNSSMKHNLIVNRVINK